MWRTTVQQIIQMFIICIILSFINNNNQAMLCMHLVITVWPLLLFDGVVDIATVLSFECWIQLLLRSVCVSVPDPMAPLVLTMSCRTRGQVFAMPHSAILIGYIFASIVSLGSALLVTTQKINFPTIESSNAFLLYTSSSPSRISFRYL